jgi:hypothetical protein
MGRLRPVLYSLSAGLILVYYSESLFWSGLNRPFVPLDLFYTWLVYSLVGYLALRLAAHCRVQTAAGWFLVGAVYGWLAEGVIVQTLYQALPISLSWTGLGWHAPFALVIGWFWMRRWLRRGWLATVGGAILIGCLQGFWSLGWWQEALIDPTAAAADLPSLVISNSVFGLLLMLGYIGVDRPTGEAVVPGRLGLLIGGGLLAAWFIGVTVPVMPVALVVLPACLLPVVWILRRGRRLDPVPVSRAQPPLARYLLILLIPIIASGIYALLSEARLEMQAVFGILLIPLGFILLAVSLWRVWRETATPAPAAPASRVGSSAGAR